ncbi:MAG: MarR family EPS-associated transcriptional regulator [Pseudomonadota bacterium]
MSKPGSSDSDAAAALDALRLLEEKPALSQRELSRELGLSLGKTHYVLRALLDKGLLKVENFRRSNNKVAYSYLLTPKGLKAKLRMTRDFLTRKEAEFELLQATIERLRREVSSAQGSPVTCSPSLIEMPSTAPQPPDESHANR